MLISIETYRICDFPGVSGPPIAPSGSAHAYDRSTCDIKIKTNIPKDRFSHAIVHFPFLERLVTSQNMMRYMILQYFIWFYIEYTAILNGIRKLWEAKKAPILYTYS